MIRNIILTVSVLFAFFSLNMQAADYEDRVKLSKDIAAGVYHPYHYGILTDSPAPKGYEPFYISHYGRHGSRYHTSMSFFKAGFAGLEAAKEAGLLTEAGRNLYKEFNTVMKAHEGMEGELTRLGASEHRGIAQRMFNRFPEVFNNKERRHIDCISSVVPRCLISMANFTTELLQSDPTLQFTFDTGMKYYQYLAKDIDSKELFRDCNRFEDSLRTSICHYDKLFDSIFTDRKKALRVVENPQSFTKSIYMAGSICYDLDLPGIDIFKYFQPDELAQQWVVRSDKMYGQFGNSKEWGDVSSAVAKGLVNDFVTKADAAMEDAGGKAADLRFGHDTGILPFFGLIGIKGMDVQYPMARAHDYWTTYDNIPMGTNFQMIFYRNAEGDVIVKMLNNEEETCLPALKPWSGVYYKWQDLRAYLISLTAE